MINKKEIIDFIDKYSLGGILDNVKWIIDNNSIFMGGTTPDSNIDVEVTLKKNYGIQPLTVGIKSTLMLKKMLNVLNDEILSILPSFRGDFVNKFQFSDGSVDITFTGSDLATVKEYIPIKRTGDLILKIPLDKQLISKFLKVKAAMTGEELVKIVKPKENKLILSIGYNDRNTDRINIDIKADLDNNFPLTYPLSFNAEYFKQILSNNPNQDTILNIYCNNNKFIGIIEFEDELYKCKYILYQRLDDEI